MIQVQELETLGSKLDARPVDWMKPLFASITAKGLMGVYREGNFNSYHFQLLHDEVQNVFLGDVKSVFLLRN